MFSCIYLSLIFILSYALPLEISPCEFGEWSKWSNCNTPCGPGTQGRLKIPTHHHKMNGCKPIVESRPCCQMTCPGEITRTLTGTCKVLVNYYIFRFHKIISEVNNRKILYYYYLFTRNYDTFQFKLKR